MNIAELSARVDALSNELGRLDDRLEAVGKKILALQEEIDRNQKNAEACEHDLRRRIMKIEDRR